MATVSSVHGQKTESNFGPMRGRPPVRGTANRKERKRTQTINSAFSELRDRIPNVPADTKLSKIKTLRLAISYIRYLMQLLDETPDPASPVLLPDRNRERIALEIATKCDENERRKRDDKVRDTPCLRQPLPRNNTISFLPRKRGRTGWPQHVWAMELKHESASSP